MVGTELNLNITEKAKKQIAKIMIDDGKEGWYLRVGVKSGGCSGLNYYMEFKEEDFVFLSPSSLELTFHPHHFYDEFRNL